MRRWERYEEQGCKGCWTGDRRAKQQTSGEGAGRRGSEIYRDISTFDLKVRHFHEKPARHKDRAELYVGQAGPPPHGTKTCPWDPRLQTAGLW